MHDASWHVIIMRGKSLEVFLAFLRAASVYLVGKYFACQQTVNGQTGALLIFIPKANNTGHYYTQNVNLQGRASGVGDLEISGDRWVYSSRWDQGGGKSTYYRTTNVFSGKNRIHYEQAESSNGRDWKVTNSGDEVRVSTGGR